MKSFLVVIILFSISLSQLESDSINRVSNTSSRYITGNDGTIKMYVNIWGHVSNPGRVLVNESIDITTLLSLAGGINKGANIKKIYVYHEYPHLDGKKMHIIDISNFLKYGDRSNFISIQPNDTFVIEPTLWSSMIEDLNSTSTMINFFSILLNLTSIILP